jgi:FdhE protein
LNLQQQPWTIEDVNREIAYYKTQAPDLAELMDLYADILAIQAEYLEKIEPGIEVDEPLEIERKVAEGAVLINARNLRIDPEQFKEVLGKMIAVVAAKTPELKPGLDRLLDHPDLNVDTAGENPLFINSLINSNTQYIKKVAELIELNTDIMFFLAYRSISPFVEAAARLYRGQYDDAAWGKTICPVCGRKPIIAFATEDGAHFLQCQICRTDWSYPEETCVVCGNTSPETYKYLYDEADPGHRVYVCDSCKKYIKETDVAALGRDIDVEVEDLATLVLDYVAKEKGYEPGGRVTFAINIEYKDPEPGDETPVDETPVEISLD